MNVSRRGLMTTGAGLAMGAAVAAPGRAAQSARPNIVWMVIHDVHAPLLGCYGNALAQTPAIDALAREGIRYDNAFSITPVCAPSRFALVTGAYPSACAPAHQMRAEAKVPQALHPLPLHMRAAGYYCTNNVFTDYNMNVDEAALWDACSIRAHWRDRPAGKPFFCVYNYLITHEGQVFGRAPTETDPAKVEVPPFLPDRPEIREVLARNIDMVNRQDAAVAHLMQELQTDGLTDDTFVFFLADHGGVHPRSKRYCYDDGLHVPLIVHVPANWRHMTHSPAGQSNAELVSHVDLAPTTLALAGAQTPKTMMGRAFLGARKTPPRQYVFSMRDRMDERYDLVHTVRDRRYRYIRNYNPQRVYGEHEAYEWQSIGYQVWEQAHLAGDLNEVQGRFWREKPVEELYDAQSDPHSVSNLAGDPAHAAQLATMRQALDAHLLEIHDNGFIPEGSSAEGYDESRAPDAYPLKELIELSNRALNRDRRNIPRFVAGLDAPNPVVRFWNAQGLILAAPLSAKVGEALAQRLKVETDDYVRCALAEALIVAGQPDLARTAMVEVLKREGAGRARLRALNVLTILPQEKLASVREPLAALAEGQGEYLHSAGKYLLLKIDGTYRPDARVLGRPNFKVDPNRPIGNPQI
jgi:arylsulfatase A-like enzyme